MIEIPVLDKGFVALEGSFAHDLSVVNSARVSFNTHHEAMQAGDDKLIAFLMKNRHGTPFEQNFFQFRVKAPIFVFREWHRHRIGVSINEWSARYSELKGEFYIPKVEDVRQQVGKPGHYTYEQASPTDADWFTVSLQMKAESAYDAYKAALTKGIAKEQARFFLPVNIYSEMYWACNARSLMAFLSLRNNDRAQWEIKQYAQVLESLFQQAMPVTAKAFIDNERIAP
jgi:thymidylate synthase (FAD)